ncbi:hypothetical protein [Mesorhizobium sp. ES1-1]|uniref:hypothetical protein n=1 Tax=Mesorhizobium sp. ES1-1 TaxID=2876629 RepID=UPI001CCE8DE6|nr:hypothetical protein [Mesorhizobium sp. ES1-1]MBZ9674938.1 hypothetical protein [Mesorhizobium sp. ES1-1]
MVCDSLCPAFGETWLAAQRFEAKRDIWSFSGIWQDFAKRPSHMTSGIDGDSCRAGPAFGRKLLLTIDVLPFLSIDADTPAAWAGDVERDRIDHLMEPVVQATPDSYPCAVA